MGKKRICYYVAACYCVFAVFTPGCGKKLPPGMPKLHPASVTVTQENAPLDNAMVQFFPTDPALSQWGPSGTTDANGVAVLSTNGQYPGVPEGHYKVIVIKQEREPHPHPEWSFLPDEDPKFRQFQSINARLKTYVYVERKYSNIVNTPLEANITAGKNELQLDAGAKVTIVETPGLTPGQ